MPNRTILHYELLEKLGRGGMGEVWKARHQQLDKIVALKFLAPEAKGDDELRARLIREARAAAALDHPNICSVHGIHEDAGEVFLEMPCIDGPSLADKIKERPLELNEALNIAIQTAQGLQQAHEQGVTHRDIKPDNVMLTSKGQVKVMDFGLALKAGGTRFTQGGATPGTPAYMAPEQLEGREVDRRSDLWALGCVLYEMLTQRPPFHEDYEQAMAYAILNEDPEPVTAQRAGLPPQIDDVLDKALAKDPAGRYQTAADLIVDLKRLRDGKISKRTVAQPVAPKPQPKWQAWAIGAVALAVFAAVFLYFRPSPAPAPPMEITERQVTSLPGREETPALSPFGDRVAFIHEPSPRQFVLLVQTVGAAEAQPLAPSAEDPVNPVWSPDGQKVAYADWEAYPNVSYWVVTPGSSPQKLTDSNFIGSRHGAINSRTGFLDWSPDGKKIALLDRESEEEANAIYLFDLSTRRKQVLTKPPAEIFGDTMPAFSPDGRRMAFLRRTVEIGDELYVIDIPQGGSSNSVPSPSKVAFKFTKSVGSVDWTPDGEELLIGANDRLYRVPLDGGEAQPLPIDGVFNFSLSGDKTKIAFAKGFSTGAEIWSIPGPRASEAEMARPPQVVLRSSASDFGARFSPDGDRILFVSRRLGDTQLWLAKADGSDPSPLTTLKPGSRVRSAPTWSPGQTIAFAYSPPEDDGADIFLVDVDGGPLRQFTDHPALEAQPTFSPDGKYLYFRSQRASETDVFRKPVAGGPAERITFDGGAQSRVSEWFVYYTKYFQAGPGVWRIPVQGGEPVHLLKDAGWHENWGLWEDTVCVRRREDQGDVDCYDGLTGELVYEYRFDRSLPYRRVSGGLSVSPDGKSIILGLAPPSESDIYLAEGLDFGPGQ